MENANKWPIYIIVDKLLFEMPILEFGINKAWFWSESYAIWAKKVKSVFFAISPFYYWLDAISGFILTAYISIDCYFPQPFFGMKTQIFGIVMTIRNK